MELERLLEDTGLEAETPRGLLPSRKMVGCGSVVAIFPTLAVPP